MEPAADEVGLEDSQELSNANSVDPLLLNTKDSVDPLLLNAEDFVDPLLLNSEDSVVLAVDSQEPDEVVLESQTPPDSIRPELPELLPDSMEVVPDSLPPDSMEVLPDSLPPGACVCGRCGLVHEDHRAPDRAHSRYYRPCPSCGLVHADYFVDAVFGRIKVNCVIFREQYKIIQLLKFWIIKQLPVNHVNTPL
jgi:hypothetical protein